MIVVFLSQLALVFSLTELFPLYLTHCSVTSVNESDIRLAVARPNNIVCVVEKDILGMTAAETLRCAGCKGEHWANSWECPLVQHALEIERLRSKGLSYREALIKLKEPSVSADSGKTYSQGSTSSNAEVDLRDAKSYSGALKKRESALSSSPMVQKLALKLQALMHVPKLITQVTACWTTVIRALTHKSCQIL